MKSRARHGVIALAVVTLLAAPSAWAQQVNRGVHAIGHAGNRGGGHSSHGAQGGAATHSRGSGHRVAGGHSGARHTSVWHGEPTHGVMTHVGIPTTVRRAHSNVSGIALSKPISAIRHTQRHGQHKSFGHVYPVFYGYFPYYGNSSYYYGNNGGSYGGSYYGEPAYPARLRILDAPPDAEIYVDGYYVGIVDDFDGVSQHLELEPGPHRIEIRAPGFEPIAVEVAASQGRTFTYRARMIPLQRLP